MKVIGSDPAIRKVMEQKIPGVIVPPGVTYKQTEELARYADFIQRKVGLLFWRGKDNSVSLYNPAMLTWQELQKADEQDRLYDLLPEYGKITGAKPIKGTVPKAPAAPAAPEPPAAPAAPVAPDLNPMGVPPASAGAKTATLRKRLKNLVPEPPTGGSSVLAGAGARAL